MLGKQRRRGVAMLIGHARVRCAGATPPTVTIDGALAADVSVVGSNWIRGKLPIKANGACPADVVVAYGTGQTLTLPEAFCFASFLP